MLAIFASPEIHVTMKADKLFNLGPLGVTNSILYGLISSIIICVLMIWAARHITVRPGKGYIRSGIDSMVEFMTGVLIGPFGTPERAARYVPVFGVFFVFVLFSNLLELLPIVGEGLYSTASGVHSPLFRPFTADINGTIAMSVIAILMVQYYSIKEQGVKKHLQHYFSDKPFNPINMLVGILEVFGEFTRVLSLSLRLFLNTAVGDILLAVFTSMVLASGRTPIAVIPIFLFEGLVAYVQAYVFMVLTGTYLGMAIAHADEHHDDHPPANIPDGVESRGMIGG